MTNDPWDVMRSGKTQEAILILRDRYASDANPPNAMSLGVAHLFSSEFELAWQYFNEFNHEHPNRISTTYGMAGVAQWCLGRRHEAATEWLNGLECEYNDAAGGVELLLLLFFASVASPQSVRRIDVQSELLRKAADARMSNWPGPLALFAIGKIDEDRLTAECRHDNQVEAAAQRMMANFYISIVHLQHKRLNEADSYMQRTASLSWDVYDLSKRLFLTMAWQEELDRLRFSVPSVMKVRVG